MMQSHQYGLCSNPTCKWNKTIKPGQKACTLCGQALILCCPDCFRELADRGLFCGFCHKRLKVSLKPVPQKVQQTASGCGRRKKT